MPMRRIPIEELKPGMVFTKSLFDTNLNIVLPAGAKLEEYNIRTLKTKEIAYLETAGELVERKEEKKSSASSGSTSASAASTASDRKKIVVDKDTARYIEFYKETVSTVSALYNKYKNEKTFDADRIQKLAAKLVSTILSEKKIETFINITNIPSKGDYLANHIVNTTVLSVLLGIKLGYSQIKLVNLSMAALLFDIGMIKIPIHITEKEGALSQEEFNRIKTHPVHSYQIIAKELGLPVEVARVGLEHHEKVDGSGYPRQIKGAELSEMSRIVSVVDTYEAITKSRSYREGKDSYEAMKSVLGEGSKKLDPEILKVFLAMMSIYPVGSYVQLNTNAIAKVISADSVSPFRPTVKILLDEFGDRVEDGEVIRLSKEKDVYIVKAVKSKQVEQE
jgi:HD-GYP domain-containing protein (c-di-GMP phosphodiesterase class II)